MENTVGCKNYLDENSPGFVIEYRGNFKEEIDKVDYACGDIINENLAVISVEEKNLDRLRKDVPSIIFIEARSIYVLQDISPINVDNINAVKINKYLNLTGKGIIIGMIDTGIDYLNKEFIREDGTSRIIKIWDQTINTNRKGNLYIGTEYLNEDINRAIESSKIGHNPYDIVASKDEIGHGTNMAGIVGALGKNPMLRGIAPECEFVAVKLIQSNFFKYNYGVNAPVYNITSILFAIEYLKNYLLANGKPVVILLPLGTNNGNHKGEHILDNYIAAVSSNVGLVVVTGTGNEGIQDCHASGIIKDKNEYEAIEIIVEKEQKILSMEVWVNLPNIVEINLIGPSGADTGFVPAILNISKKYSFIFEQTRVSIYYNLPEEYTGDQLIRIYFHDIRPGIWKIRIRLRLGKMAEYNAWLPQRGLTLPGTRFISSDQYGTLTIPGDSEFIITVAAYNQNNNNLLAYSGVALRNAYKDVIDFAAGGVNTMTVGINNKVDIINGTSLAAAIGAGACVLLFEWGIVDKNYSYMYSQSIKTFLNRGTLKRPGDMYPNPQLGYGIINFYKIFENMI